MLNAARRQPDPRVFAALGDPTRLRLVERLHRTDVMSISALSEGTDMTRQAVTKHLRILSDAGLVRDVRHGRQRLFALDAAPLSLVASWIETFRKDWEDRFDRLDAFLAETDPNAPDQE